MSVSITDLRTELSADPTGRGYAVLLTELEPDPEALADLLNTPASTQVVATEVSARTILSRIGAIDGSVILDKLEAAATAVPPVKWVVRILESNGSVNMGDPQSRLAADALAAQGHLDQAEADALKALAEVPASRADLLFGGPVSEYEVRLALWNDDGTRAF